MGDHNIVDNGGVPTETMIDPALAGLGSTIAGLGSGILGLYQLFAGGPGSISGTINEAANAADPFSHMRQGFQGQLQGQIGAIQGTQGGTNANLMGQAGAANAAGYGAAGNAANYANLIQSLSGGVRGLNTFAGGVPGAVSGSGGMLNQNLDALASNFMQDPAIQAEYKLGLDTVNRGLAAGGFQGSGQQQAELERYGQQFAGQAYEEQFKNILEQSQAAFGQNVGATQLGAQLQGQTFGQGMQQQQALAGLFGEAGQLSMGGQGQLLQALGLGGNLMGENSQLLLSSGQGLLNSLLLASGATTSSPATAGSIISQQFGNTQQAVQNVGQGAGGTISGLSNLINSLNGFFGSGSGGGGFGLGDNTFGFTTGLGDTLGSFDTGSFGGLSGLFGPGGGFGGDFGSFGGGFGDLTSFFGGA